MATEIMMIQLQLRMVMAMAMLIVDDESGVQRAA